MKLQLLNPTRPNLQAQRGTTTSVTAVYVRTGRRIAHGRVYETVLLRDVRDANSGLLLADHLWFNRGNLWRQARLKSGDCIRFEARPVEYRVGYRGPNSVRRAEAPARVDFKLTPPESLQIIRRAASNHQEAA